LIRWWRVTRIVWLGWQVGLGNSRRLIEPLRFVYDFGLTANMCFEYNTYYYTLLQYVPPPPLFTNIELITILLQHILAVMPRFTNIASLLQLAICLLQITPLMEPGHRPEDTRNRGGLQTYFHFFHNMGLLRVLKANHRCFHTNKCGSMAASPGHQRAIGAGAVSISRPCPSLNSLGYECFCPPLRHIMIYKIDPI